MLLPEHIIRCAALMSRLHTFGPRLKAIVDKKQRRRRSELLHTNALTTTVVFIVSASRCCSQVTVSVVVHPVAAECFLRMDGKGQEWATRSYDGSYDERNQFGVPSPQGPFVKGAPILVWHDHQIV